MTPDGTVRTVLVPEYALPERDPPWTQFEYFLHQLDLHSDRWLAVEGGGVVKPQWLIQLIPLDDEEPTAVPEEDID